MNSHKRLGEQSNPHPLDGHAFRARRPVGTQDGKGLAGTILSQAEMKKTEVKN